MKILKDKEIDSVNAGCHGLYNQEDCGLGASNVSYDGTNNAFSFELGIGDPEVPPPMQAVRKLTDIPEMADKGLRTAIDAI